MDNQKIITLLCIIIIILIVCVAMLALPQLKEESKLTIVDKTISEGDSLVVVLKDAHGNGLSDATINIKLTDEDGITINEDVKTNSKGKAKLKVDESGKYSADCTFKGDGKYASSSVSENIKVKKATTEVVKEKQTSTTTHSSKYAADGSIYPEYGPEVDSRGYSREYAIAHNWHYLPQTIDGMDAGVYTPYDPIAGCYHT